MTDCATRCCGSLNDADQATDGRACVGDGQRVESGILHDGADQSVGAVEEDRVESRQELMKSAMEGMLEQPELGVTHERPTSRKDGEKVCGLAVESGLEGHEGQRLEGEDDRAKDRPEPMKRALEDVPSDVDSKAAGQTEQGTSMEHVLGVLRVLPTNAR